MQTLGDFIPSVVVFLEGARSRRLSRRFECSSGFRGSTGREGIFVAIRTLLLADDNPVILEYFRGLLGQTKQYQVVGAVTSGDAVQSAYSRLQPDIIVLDISMGEISGIDVAQDLLDSGCKAKIVFLTVHEDADFIHAAMGAGGSAYVVKSRVSNDLIAALDAVLSGKCFVSSCHSL
jgi:DNA-binding NarL/FixJ family response regulator